MADFGTFDLARAYASAEDIKAARQVGELRGVQTDLAKLQLEQARQPSKLTYDQLFENTQMTYAAATDVAANPGRASYWEAQLKRAGVLSPEASLANIPPQQLQQAAVRLAKESGSVLAALDPKTYGGDKDEKRSSYMQLFVEMGGDPRDAAGFTKFYNEQKAKDNQGQERSPYYQAVPTATGVGSFNSRTGQYTPPSGTGGAGVLRTPDDPAVRAAVTGAEKGATLNAERAQQIQVRLTDMKTSGEILETASDLVRAATGSYAGALVDKFANVFGFSPSGDQAIGALKVIAARLQANVPRFEGAQSDKDTTTYAEAAGDLGNPTTPAPKKLAAIRTIRELDKKYQAQQGGQVTPATPTTAAPFSDADKERRYQEWKRSQGGG